MDIRIFDNNFDMLTLMLRCIVIYLVVLLVFRLMGKRQLGEFQPFEFVITLMIADLASIPMSEINVPLLHGIVPLVSLSILHFLISFLSRKSIAMRKLLNGKPVIVINPDGIDYDALRKLNMDFDDLCESLRELNFFALDEVAYAIVETNGKMTVLPNAQNAPLTAQDLKIKKERASLPIMLVCDGKPLKENMKIAKIDIDFLQKQCARAGAYKIRDVAFASIDNNGKMYIEPRNKKYKTFYVSFEGGENW